MARIVLCCRRLFHYSPLLLSTLLFIVVGNPVRAAGEAQDSGVLLVASAAGLSFTQQRDQALIAWLTDPDPEFRQQAALKLGDYQVNQAAGALQQALQDPVPKVRAEAAKALGKLQGDGAVAGLTLALKDQDVVVRVRAAMALGEIGDKKGVTPLVTLLRDPHPDARWAAVCALGQLRDPAALEPLKAVREDPDPSVRAAVNSALGQLSTSISQDTLFTGLRDTAALVRQTAILSYNGSNTPQVLGAFTRMLQDPDISVRLAAISA
ncbi:MAG TPA: HEAT repeat domain-containing protein, partial [Armatimonadota bacterium]